MQGRRKPFCSHLCKRAITAVQRYRHSNKRVYLEKFRKVDGAGHVVVDLANHLKKLFLSWFLPHRFQHLQKK